MSPDTSFFGARGKLWPSAKAFLNESRMNLVVLLVFAANFVLLFSIFFPDLNDITGFAEAAYINNGRRLVEGALTPFGYSPLSSILYALTYFPVRESPYWLIYSCALGRMILFSFLWMSTYMIARTNAALAPTLLVAAMVLVSPALLYLVRHGSHAVFAVTSAFALWQFLLFHRSGLVKHLVGASLFVGLSTLARSGEGLVLWVVLAVIGAFISRDLKKTGASLVAAILPCAILLSSYVVVYRALVGRFDLGMAEYSYFTFEQGHGLAYKSQYRAEENYYVAGQMEARRLFGSPEENDYSITTAIFRNPKAYFDRVPRLISIAPLEAIAVYGGTLGLLFFLFAARGAIELIRRKRYSTLLLLLAWSSYVLLYLVLVFQPTHFLLPYYVVFLLASVGLTAAVSNYGSIKERYAWSATLLGLIVTAAALQRANFFVAGLLLLLTLAIIWWIASGRRGVRFMKAFGIMVAFTPFLLQAHYPQPRFPKIGIGAEEQATLFMQEKLKPGAIVGAHRPMHVWMAKLNYVPMFRSGMPELRSDQDFSAWLKANHLDAIYSDTYLRIQEPAIWELVQRQIGQTLNVAFSSDNGDIQVLLSATSSSDEAVRSYIELPWYSAKQRFKAGPRAE